MSSDLFGAVFSSLIPELRNVKTGQLLTMAGLCLGAYDCTLTFDEERRHIWMQPWSVTKVMYIFNRYGMICVSLYFIIIIIPLVVVNEKVVSWCKNSVIAMVIIQLLIAFAGLAVTLDRMAHLWGFSKRSWMYIFMFSGYIGMHAVSVAFGSLGGISLYRKIYHYAIPFTGINGCGVDEKPISLAGVYAPCALNDIFSFLLLLFNALSRPRSEKEKLLELLYGDGMIFFLYSFSMHLFNLIVVTSAPPSLQIIGLNFGDALGCNAYARFYLRLCEDDMAIEKNREETESIDLLEYRKR